MTGSKRKIVAVLGLVVLCFGVLVTRAVLEGRSALGKGDRAMAAGNADEAIRWWRRAARWYVPGASHPEVAYDRLREVASTSEPEIAVLAWRSIRRSVIATRSLYRPFQERLTEANREIAQLMAASDTSGDGAKQTLEEREHFHLALLERPVGVSVGWALLAALGLALWIGGAFYFALRGIDEDDRWVRRPSLIAAAAITVGLVLWALGLHLA